MLRELAQHIDGNKLTEDVWDDSGRVVRGRTVVGALLKELDELRRLGNPHPVLSCTTHDNVIDTIYTITDDVARNAVTIVIEIAERRAESMVAARDLLHAEPPSLIKDNVLTYLGMELSSSHYVSNALQRWMQPAS